MLRTGLGFNLVQRYLNAIECGAPKRGVSKWGRITVSHTAAAVAVGHSTAAGRNEPHGVPD